MVQASLEVIEDLEKLVKEWKYSSQNPAWLFRTLLPQLQADPSSGTPVEKRTLAKLRREATPEEWSQLGSIAEDLAGQRAAINALADTLNQHFAAGRYAEAQMLARQGEQASIADLYESIRRRVTDEHMVSIAGALQDYRFQEAERQYEAIVRVLDETQKANYLTRLAQSTQEFTGVTIHGIREACERRDYEGAEALYSQPGHTLSQDEYKALANEARQRQAQEDRARFVARTLAAIWQCLERYDFDGAEAAYEQVRGEYPEEIYRQRLELARTTQAGERLVGSIRQELEAGDFATADRLYRSTDLIAYDDFLDLKAPYIQTYVERVYSQTVSQEQARTLSGLGRNTLISARAGSGKTRVLASKAALLIDVDNVDPDQILVMAFNNTAAEEIGDRIHTGFGQSRFDNARTFHSLAHQLVNPLETILYDVRDDVVTRYLTLFVQELLEGHMACPEFSGQVYTFLRKEMREITQAGSGLPDEAYLEFRRNLRQVTLNGERVKSVGEKYIADYLFERDIPYTYEKTRLWEKRIYRPDFTIYLEDQEYVIEHWGIDEHDPEKRVPPEWTNTWAQYRAAMRAKRRYWKGKSTCFVETSIRDLREGRHPFEKVLENRLVAVGLNKPKLTTKELQRKIRENDRSITRLAELCVQFIQRAKKKLLKSQDIQKNVLSYQAADSREKAFLGLACQVYASYEQELTRQGQIDFDDLLARAVDRIALTQGECTLPLDSTSNQAVRIADLRWILIDEYQDFSELFYRLVDAIRAANSEIRLFCVGDDWQAINGFAGSDLAFFREFGRLFGDAESAHLVSNYRSQARIVEHSNALMTGQGVPGRHLPQNGDGDVTIYYIDDMWVELRGDPIWAEERDNDQRFYVTRVGHEQDGTSAVHVVASKYLKKCYEIITRPQNAGKSVAILCRTNWIDGITLPRFRECLIASFSADDREALGNTWSRIEVETVHMYKGREADVVIILEACDGKFPLLHPDNTLFGCFGVTLGSAFEEERRLFYVALTRAKESLTILTERERESVFLRHLPA